MKTVTIVADDRVGLLADISYILGKSSVNIEGLCVDVIGGKAIVALDVKDPSKTISTLENNGFKTTDPSSIVIKVANNSMEKITEMLGVEKIKVTELATLSADSNDGIFALNVDKPRKANRVLSPFMLRNAATPY